MREPSHGHTVTTSWFRPEDFEDPNFEAEAYVQRRSTVVPLDKLLQRLQQHVETIRADLVDVINADYPMFINMASKLGGVEESAVQIQTPLLKLKESLGELQERYQSEMQSLKECLERQSQIHHTKMMLELVQDAMSVMGKLESLTYELPDISLKDEILDVTSASAQVERIGSEVSRLAFYMTKGSSIPLVQSLGPRFSSVTSKLRTVITATLNKTLSSASEVNDSAAGSCIHASSLIMDMDVAYTAIQDCLIQPALRKAVSGCAQASGNSSDADRKAPFPAFLSSVRAELEPSIRRVTSMLSNHPGLAGSFDLLGACVLRPLYDMVKVQLPGSFSTADPSTFHKNYTSAMDFISWLEDSASTEGALQLFHSSSAHSDFTRAWNLAVYFSLQFQEIAGKFDSSLRVAPAAMSVDDDWIFQQTAAVCTALQQCRDSSITFPAVYDRFLRLQLQVLGRCCTQLMPVTKILFSSLAEVSEGHVQAGPRMFSQRVLRAALHKAYELYGWWLEEAGSVDSNGASQAVTGNHIVAHSNDKHVHAPTQSSQGAQNMQQWAKSASAEDLLLVLVDAAHLVEHIKNEQLGSIMDQLKPATSETALEQAREAVLTAANKVEHNMESIEQLVTQHILNEASSWFRHVRSIATTFRMTNRPAPTRPSHYVPPLLRNVQELVKSSTWAKIPEPVQERVLQRLVSAITDTFKTSAIELIDTIIKTQLSLTRIGRVRHNPSDGAAETPSDIDKMQQQLRLDVQEYGTKVEGLTGKPVSNMGCFQELLQVVEQPIGVSGNSSDSTNQLHPLARVN